MSTSTDDDMNETIAALWTSLSERTFASTTLRLTTTREILPSIYRVGSAATASIALAGLAFDRFRRTLGETPRAIAVDGREASLAFRSEAFLRIDGRAPDLWAPLSADYRASDGYVRLHANYPQHRRAISGALGTTDPSAVTAAIRAMRARDVEAAIVDAGGAAAALRSRATWRASEAYRAIENEPLVAFEQIGDAPTAPPHAPWRVLDLTRVISGPLCCKVLASLGADVLRIGTPALPELDAMAIESGFGKRFAFLDLRDARDRERFETLVRDADAIVQSHRPGALEELGYGPEAIAALRPGIAYVSISAYGRRGPWARRRGFDSLVQLATGLADDARIAYGREAPVPLPAQALDHATGWLAAFGTTMALERRARVGGSWRVDLSLARTAEWLASLGISDARDAALPRFEDANDLLEETSSAYGRITHLGSPLVVDGVRVAAGTPPTGQGSDAARWL